MIRIRFEDGGDGYISPAEIASYSVNRFHVVLHDGRKGSALLNKLPG